MRTVRPLVRELRPPDPPLAFEFEGDPSNAVLVPDALGHSEGEPIGHYRHQSAIGQPAPPSVGTMTPMGASCDPHDLARFVKAQDADIDAVLRELRDGRKRTHWMWFVFPQVAGLGSSPMARLYAIGSLAEARAYLAHPLLGSRLRECCTVVLRHRGADASTILGSPDALKLRSSMTLFAGVADDTEPFGEVLDVVVSGEGCGVTRSVLEAWGVALLHRAGVAGLGMLTEARGRALPALGRAHHRHVPSLGGQQPKAAALPACQHARSSHGGRGFEAGWTFSTPCGSFA